MIEARRIVATVDLKKCALCGAINSQRNNECFACDWAGNFEFNRGAIFDGVLKVLERHPEFQTYDAPSDSREVPRRAWIASMPDTFRLYFKRD